MMNIRKQYQEKDSVLNTDSYDRERFAQLTDISPKLGEKVEEQYKKNQSYPALMGDMWSSLYKVKPQIKDEEEAMSNLINKELIQRVLDDEVYQQFHKTTKLDDFTSAIGTLRLNQHVNDWMEQQQAENGAFQESMDELLRKQKELEKHFDKQLLIDERLKNAESDVDSNELSKAKAQKKRAEEKMEKLQEELNSIQSQAHQHLTQALSSKSENFSNSIQSALNDTVKSKEDMEKLLSGGTGAGTGNAELKRIPLKDQISLAESLRNNQKFKDMAEWAGKFKKIARKKQKVKYTESLDRSGMTLGNDVERILPQELALLRNSATRLDFLRRFAEEQTMMYSPQGKESLGKGPLVLCLDQSGSMHDLDSQSKGFVLALAMIAKKQKRDFAVIPFSNKTGPVFKYEKGKFTPNQLVELAEYFLGGGTTFVPAINDAITIINNEKRFKKADIIFVTDGDPGDTGSLRNDNWIRELKQFKKETNTSILSLLIGNDVQERWVSVFSDKVIRSDDFDKEKAHDVFAI